MEDCVIQIFCVTYVIGRFGLALTEAKECRTPVVGYKNCSAVNELIVNGKMVFCEDGIDDLAEKLSVLMQNKNLRVEFGVNSHK